MANYTGNHTLLPNGEFIICHHTYLTGQGCGPSNVRFVNREAREISRHYANQHTAAHIAAGRKVDYQNCRVITRAAALALVGPARLAHHERRGGGVWPEAPFPNTPRDPNWMPPAAAAAPVAAPVVAPAALSLLSLLSSLLPSPPARNLQHRPSLLRRSLDVEVDIQLKSFVNLAVTHMSLVNPRLNREIILYVESSEDPAARWEDMSNFRNLEVLELFRMCRKAFDWESFQAWWESCEDQEWSKVKIKLSDGDELVSRVEWYTDAELMAKVAWYVEEGSETEEQGQAKEDETKDAIFSFKMRRA
ncbi:uncharacterized protein AB675_8664 [Cyphellophora attinorum]|uniref:Uncharacterized protein n=1 Tax=Cyphellophora attinorum TaxID=1664694 RepID=A0A0N0NQX0_9EURO|nr:uncharacterized protein AB675_8664 [Phialophora attinorum]KPI44408.1 hypothetical protein AB675_8664 [Phialophora attinorum]